MSGIQTFLHNQEKLDPGLALRSSREDNVHHELKACLPIRVYSSSLQDGLLISRKTENVYEGHSRQFIPIKMQQMVAEANGGGGET